MENKLAPVATIHKNIRTEVVELNIGSSVGNSYNFGQLPNIREAKAILSIEAYDVSQVALSPNNKNVITNTVLKKSYLKLVELGGSAATIRTMPLYDINSQGTAKKVEELNAQPIDWEKSTVLVPETTGLTANESFIFKVKYLK